MCVCVCVMDRRCGIAWVRVGVPMLVQPYVWHICSLVLKHRGLCCLLRLALTRILSIHPLVLWAWLFV